MAEQQDDTLIVAGQGDWKTITAGWIARQSVSTVLLMLFTGAFCAGCWYAGKHILTVIIPNHIDQLGERISDTVTKIEASHREEREGSEKRHQSHIDEIVKRFSDQQAKDHELMREMIFRDGKKAAATFPLSPPQN